MGRTGASDRETHGCGGCNEKRTTSITHRAKEGRALARATWAYLAPTAPRDPDEGTPGSDAERGLTLEVGEQAELSECPSALGVGGVQDSE
ncbi:hypothetical protein NDU88_003936 [Pleurodeles waltl]|uniref:Uncharacterized protein n=1 Tax=Pleurodeles waltl TaxID=8319 RepID=A0AAV7LGU4_PLEWA|nr:hypothetical protein NDU88_003936 [Pleurodeles waltl]